MVDGSNRQFEAANGARRRSSLKGVRILVVDDNRLSRCMTSHVLESHGCVTRGVMNGAEALLVLQYQPYEVVIMDLEMPRLDGPGATRAIRNPDSRVLNPRVPIIGLTNVPEKEGKERCLAAGMDDYLTKPVDPCVIYNAIMKQILKREVGG
ncbi:MAG: response regulator [Candidatus Eisenbacteria bacterium]